MSDAARIAEHVLENLRRALAARADELAHLWRCGHCGAQPGASCHTPSGVRLELRPVPWPESRRRRAVAQRRSRFHRSRLAAVYAAQASPRVRDLVQLLEREPERAVMHMSNCALYRAIAPTIWSVPKPARPPATPAAATPELVSPPIEQLAATPELVSPPIEQLATLPELEHPRGVVTRSVLVSIYLRRSQGLPAWPPTGARA